MDNKNYMMLSDEQEFMDAIFNNDIVVTQTYASSNNSGLHTYIQGANQNFNSSTDFNISLPKNNYMLMNSAYFKFEIDVKTTTADGSKATFLIPNFILNLLNTINISSEDFSYTNSNFNSGRSLATLINIIKARSYTPNQMMLVSLLENMTFSVSNSNNNTIDLNEGLCIAKDHDPSNVGPRETRYYINVPIDMLLPISDKIKFMSGSLQLNLNFAYQTNFITGGKPINDFTTGRITNTVKATIDLLKINSITLHYPAIRSFNDNFVSNNTIQRLSGINVKRHVLNTVRITDVTTDKKGTVLATMNSSGSISSTGKPLQMIIIPRIASCTIGGTANSRAPTINAAVPDSSISTLICSDNVTENNSNFILNGLMYVSELVVKSPSGTVYPSNRTQLLTKSSFSDSFNYLNSFIYVQGFDPSGRNSNSCLSFNQYKNYQKALVVDLTNSTTSSVDNNTSFDVSFNINAIDQFQVLTTGNTAGKVDYVFDGEVYIVSMNVI